jgi:hypothetical protein
VESSKVLIAVGAALKRRIAKYVDGEDIAEAMTAADLARKPGQEG